MLKLWQCWKQMIFLLITCKSFGKNIWFSMDNVSMKKKKKKTSHLPSASNNIPSSLFTRTLPGNLASRASIHTCNTHNTQNSWLLLLLHTLLTPLSPQTPPSQSTTHVHLTEQLIIITHTSSILTISTVISVKAQHRHMTTDYCHTHTSGTPVTTNSTIRKHNTEQLITVTNTSDTPTPIL